MLQSGAPPNAAPGWTIWRGASGRDRKMTWQPAARAEWVRLVNAGAIDPITREACEPFDRDRLLGETLARAGVDGRGTAPFGDEGFLEALDLLAHSLEDEADLTIVGRWMTHRFLRRLLLVRV